MDDNAYGNIKKLLASTQIGDLENGLELLSKEVGNIGHEQAGELFEMVSAIFYIDPLDHPDLMPVLDEAVTLVVGFGNWVIPFLIEKLCAGDLKAQTVIAHALGRIGADSIAPLINEYQRVSDPMRRSFILYALGKITSPEIIRALDIVLSAARSSDIELRDTATRTIGKLVESIKRSDLSEEKRLDIIEQLKNNLSDENSGIRAKAMRSLGKLAKYGHLNKKERETLKTACYRVLGKDRFEWDRAYVVRKQAEEVLNYL